MSTGALISDHQSGLRDYVAIIRRRWRWFAGTVAIAVAIALVVSYLTTPLYRSTAQLTFVRQPDISSALGGTTLGLSTSEVQRESETNVELMTTDEMRSRAEEELGRPIPNDVSIEAEYVPDTSVLRISAISDDPSEAQAVANAYAIGFTSWRRQVTIEQYKQAEKIVTEKLHGYGTDPAAQQDPGYIQLLGRLQDIRVLEAAATGNFVVASAGALPTAPFVPQHLRDFMVGLLIGIVAGIGVVALVEQLDVRVHSVEDVAVLLGLPVLARFPRASRADAAGDGVTVVTTPSGPVAEAFRMLRGNLEFVDVDREVKSMIITSCSQGEGKTTTVANLSVTLARTGSRVLVVDCDMRRPRIHRFFGLPNKTGLSTVVAGKTSLAEVLRDVDVKPKEVERALDDETAVGSLTVLTSGPLPPNPGEIVASQRLAGLLTELSRQYDEVLLDAPPFLVVGDTAALARVADGLVVVSRLGTVTKAMLGEAGQFLAPLPCAKLGVVVTGIPVEGSAYRYRSYHEESGADEGADAAVTATPEEPAAEPPKPLPEPLTRS